MKIRNAGINDAETIHSLICRYAELDRMLFRSPAYVYENLQMFKVAELEQSDVSPARVVGCCALQVMWSDLAEIKSLAVDKASLGKGIGKALVLAEIELAKELGLPRVFTLTLEPGFFKKLNFRLIEKDTLPMKVWSDCAKCSKQDHCDEIAMVYEIKG